MAIKLFELGFVLKAIDQMTGPMHRAMASIESLNTAAKAASEGGLQEAAGTMAKVGLAGLAAGGAMAYGLAKLVGPAMEAQGQLAHMATAMTDAKDIADNLAPANLKLIEIAKQHAESITALRDAYYDARSTNLDHAQSLAAIASATNLATATARTAQDAQENLAPTTRLLGGLFQNLGDATKDPTAQIATFADQLAVMQTSQAFHSLQELNDAMKYAAPLTAVARTSFSDQNTALSILSAGMKHGEEAGTSYVEVLTTILNHAKAAAYAVRNSAGGLDIGATIKRLADATRGLDGIQRAQFLHGLGFQQRSIQGLGILIDKTDEWAAVHKRLEDSRGAAAQLAAMRERAADFQLAKFANNWQILREQMGETLLPAVNYLLPRLTSALQRLESFAESHKGMIKLGLEIAAVASGLLVIGGALSLIGSAVLGFVGAFNTIVAVGGVIASLSLPVLAVIAAVAGLGVAAYESWKHWDAVKSFFKTWGLEVLGFIVAPWAMLPYEIYKHIGAIKQAASSVAGAIGRFFVGHSPIPEGPLRNLNLNRQIALSMADPAPILAAVRRAALATAIAVPMMIGGAAAPAMAMPAAGRASAPVVVNVTYVVNANSPQEWVAAAKEHGRELARIIEDVLEREDRKVFS